jgi:hypothetical protein
VRRAAAALFAAALLAGCGTPSADLFVVHRSGSIPGARLTLLVSDGGFVRCNGSGPDRDLPDPLLLDARALARDLEKPAKRGLTLPPGPGSVLTYSVRLEDGTVRFSDTSPRQPAVFRRLALFVRQVAKGPCRLAR